MGSSRPQVRPGTPNLLLANLPQEQSSSRASFDLGVHHWYTQHSVSWISEGGWKFLL